jgi:hypothetical protein
LWIGHFFRKLKALKSSLLTIIYVFFYIFFSFWSSTTQLFLLFFLFFLWTSNLITLRFKCWYHPCFETIYWNGILFTSIIMKTCGFFFCKISPLGNNKKDQQVPQWIFGDKIHQIHHKYRKNIVEFSIFTL